jgi:hypothetical protein
VIPGYSSFLILEILDAKNALALATMPASVPMNTTFPAGSWFLHNFGLKDGRKWRIEAKPCNYLVQQMDNTLSISFVKYIDVGNSEKIQVKIIPNSRGKVVCIRKKSKGVVISFLECKIYSSKFTFP